MIVKCEDIDSRNVTVSNVGTRRRLTVRRGAEQLPGYAFRAIASAKLCRNQRSGQTERGTLSR